MNIRKAKRALRTLYSHLWRCRYVYTEDNDGWYIDYAIDVKLHKQLVVQGLAEQRGPTPDSFDIAFRITDAGLAYIGEKRP